MRYADILEGRTARPAATPVNPDVLDRLVELVMEFVTRAPILDTAMDEVMRDWPRPAKGMTLWRVQILTKRQAKQLAAGNLVLKTHRYLSWTSSAASVEMLAAARSRGAGVPAIIEMKVPAASICIDVNDFVDRLLKLERDNPQDYDFDLGDLVQFESEAEVIVAHDKPLILNATNTRLHVPDNVAIRPKVGELVYRSNSLSDDGSPIKRVLRKNRNGTWRIEWYDGEDDIRYVAPNEWETVDYYE